MKKNIFGVINAITFIALLSYLLNYEEILHPQLSTTSKLEFILFIIVALINVGKSIIQNSDNENETNYFLLGKRK